MQNRTDRYSWHSWPDAERTQELIELKLKTETNWILLAKKVSIFQAILPLLLAVDFQYEEFTHVSIFM